MRTSCDWRSGSVDSYKDFCKRNPSISLSIDVWRNIIYSFNESFRDYILETGEKAKYPYGIGYFSINKKYRKKTTGKNNEFINLPFLQTQLAAFTKENDVLRKKLSNVEKLCMKLKRAGGSGPNGQEREELCERISKEIQLINSTLSLKKQ